MSYLGSMSLHGVKGLEVTPIDRSDSFHRKLTIWFGVEGDKIDKIEVDFFASEAKNIRIMEEI